MASSYDDDAIHCAFCHETFSSSNTMRDHLMLCGNKTDQCPRCHRLIRRAIFTYHYENNCANIDPNHDPEDEKNAKSKTQNIPITITCPSCHRNFDRADYRVHKDNCVMRSESRHGSTGFSDHRSTREELIPCESCNQSIPFQSYERHLSICRNSPNEQQARQSRDANPYFDYHHHQCRHCNRLVAWHDRQTHEDYCDRNHNRYFYF